MVQSKPRAKFITAANTFRARRTLADYLQRDADRSLHQNLSDREFQILKFLAQHKSTAEIIEKLSLSASSVKTYRPCLLQKLNVKTTAAIIHYAFANNHVD